MCCKMLYFKLTLPVLVLKNVSEKCSEFPLDSCWQLHRNIGGETIYKAICQPFLPSNKPYIS